MSSTLPLSPIVDVTVTVTPLAATRRDFNQGLIIGPSTVISTTDRIAEYYTTSAMKSDGFTTTSPEYLAAEIYFSQDPAPDRVWIGCKGSSETWVAAVEACREANTDWYTCTCVALASDTTNVIADTDHEAIALYVESCTPTTTYFFRTDESAVLTATAGNIFETLAGLDYDRTLGMYSASIYAAVALMGYAMGQNTGLANSAYTLKFKTLTGITVDTLTATQVSKIEGNYGNVYINRGYYYDMFEQGYMASGSFFDEIINIDMLVNDLQLNCMDVLYALPKVPQTEAGMTLLINACNSACASAVTRGYLAPGTWNGSALLDLAVGDTLSLGYLVQSEAIADQTEANRQARIAPPIYVAVKEAGAVHSMTIGVYVNQ